MYISRKRNTALAEQQATETHGAEEQSANPSKTPNKKEFKLSGRRIVNIADFIDQIKMLDNHSPIGCNFSNMVVVSEVRQGLRNGFVVECTMCKFKQTIWSEKINEKEMDVNKAGVCGTIVTGGGHAQLEEFLSTLDIPAMSNKTFKKTEEQLSEGWTATAAAEMEAAAAEEAQLARENNEVDKDGVPLITVVADGAWCKRSYRTNYSSLSGVVSVILNVFPYSLKNNNYIKKLFFYKFY